LIEKELDHDKFTKLLSELNALLGVCPSIQP
jgi:hypothetical protein